MNTKKKANMLKIYVGEQEKINGEPACDVVVREARKMDILNITLYKCLVYKEVNTPLRAMNFLSANEPPVVIEIIDSSKKLNDFLKPLDKILEQCNGVTVLMQKAEIKCFGKKFNEFAIF